MHILWWIQPDNLNWKNNTDKLMCMTGHGLWSYWELDKEFFKSIIFLSKSQIKLSNKAFTAIGLLDLSITFMRFQTINHINCVFPFQFYNQQKLLSDFVMWPALWNKVHKNTGLHTTPDINGYLRWDRYFPVTWPVPSHPGMGQLQTKQISN